MSNKKRISSLIKRRYKPEKNYPKIFPKIPWHFSEKWDRFTSDFSDNFELLASAAEKAANSALEFLQSSYNFVPKALLYPGEQYFNTLPLTSKADQREIYNFHLASGRSSGKSGSIVDYLFQINIEEIGRKHSAILSQYIRRNLEDFGFFFESESEFLNFVSGRITRISFSENMYHFEYYLDYVSETNKGVLIGVSDGKVNWSYEPNKITVTIG